MQQIFGIATMIIQRIRKPIHKYGNKNKIQLCISYNYVTYQLRNQSELILIVNYFKSNEKKIFIQYLKHTCKVPQEHCT